MVVTDILQAQLLVQKKKKEGYWSQQECAEIKQYTYNVNICIIFIVDSIKIGFIFVIETKTVLVFGGRTSPYVYQK